MTAQHRERPQMILVAMLRLSKGKARPLKYEDIVVEAFKLFPDEFALRGYPAYPDSSDIHKPLYGILKKKGFIRAANKTFTLTSRGTEIASQLRSNAGAAIKAERSGDRMSRDVKLELERMLACDAYKLFVEGKQERILDTDFFRFLGCTVRTTKNDFIGRRTATDEAVNKSQVLGQPDEETAAELVATWSFLQEKFKDIIERRRERS